MEDKTATSQRTKIVGMIRFGFFVTFCFVVIANLSGVYVSTSGYKASTVTSNYFKLIPPLLNLDRDVEETIYKYKIIGKSTPDEALNLLGELDKLTANFNKDIEQLSSNELLPKEVNIAEVKTKYSEISEKGKLMALAYIDKDKKKGDQLSEELEKVGDKLIDMVMKATKTIQDSIAKDSENNMNMFSTFKKWNVVLILISVLFVVIIALRVIKAVLAALDEERRILSDKISEVVTVLSQNISKFMSTSNNLFELGNRLSDNSTQQEHSSNSALTASQRIDELMKFVVKATDDAARVSEDNQKKVSKGQDVITKMSETIQDLHRNNQQLSEIVQFINEIEHKTKMINNIVFQTRLLSFNASVEAARAGEHGKGFAVVAQEIGTLAEQSGKSADEINKLLTDSISKVTHIVKMIQDSSRVSEGVVDESIKIYGEIKILNDKSAHAVDQISHSSQETMNNITETIQSVHDIDKVIRANKTMTDETNNQVSIIKDQSEELQNVIQNLEGIIRN